MWRCKKCGKYCKLTTTPSTPKPIICPSNMGNSKWYIEKDDKYYCVKLDYQKIIENRKRELRKQLDELEMIDFPLKKDYKLKTNRL